VCKQPKSNKDIAMMIGAMRVQEIDCIRYKGNDKRVIRIMKKEGLLDYLDDKD